MKTRRYSEAQVFRILKEIETGSQIVNVAREHGVSPATIHRWKSQYDGMTLSELKRLKTLEEENGYIESFNDKLRDECLNREVFRNGREAQAIVENWRQEYNNYRPHSSLGYLTPSEFARQYYEQNQVREVKQPVEKAESFSCRW